MNNKIISKAVKYATLKRYDKFEELLKPFISDTQCIIHDMIARIAIITADEKLLSMTNHHTRIMMKDFASTDHFPFLMTFYNGNIDVPSYVWENMNRKNIKFMKNQFPTLCYGKFGVKKV